MTEPDAEPLTGSILLVDDNPTNIDVLYTFLADVGFEVLVAEDGVSALERVGYARPDLILLDIMIPHMDGFEVCRKLKENPETRDVPVLFITAMGSVEDKVRGFSMGGVDYITKPFQNQEILARIRNHMELQRMRKELEVRNEHLEEQNEALDAYARTVAHDLKNPLNLVLNFAKFIQEEGALSGQSADDLQHILQSAQTMNHIIQDLLLLAQMREEDIPAETVVMTQVVDGALERLSTEIDQRDAVIERPEDWPDAQGVAPWIQAVWVNYITNALKYGGTPPKVVLFWEEDKEDSRRIRYGVIDNGAGIKTPNPEVLFEEFSRTGDENEEGHGIGLSICRRIINRLGGDVRAENLPDGGSCFSFALKKGS
jgi:DNA-binding response OmpR family regulator